MSAPRKPHPIESLSFVTDRTSKSRTNVRRCFWNVQPTGNYGDGQQGGDLAIEYLRYQAEQARLLPDFPHGDLGLIVQDMPSEHTQVEIGFLHLIDYAARHGLIAAERLRDHYKRCELARTHGAVVNVRGDGSVVIERPDGTRAVYRKEGAA